MRRPGPQGPWGTSVVVTTGDAPGTEWVEVREAAPHLTAPGTAPPESDPAPDVLFGTQELQE